MKHAHLIPVCLFFIANTLTAANYYWIGGSGNWADISHWATQSGGAVTHNQVPTADDDVYFDANSFTGPEQVVFINNDNIFCKNMDWTGAAGNPVFRGDAGKVINIFGSLNFISGMVFDFAGEVRFRSPELNTPVQPAGHHLGREVLFDGDGGWILSDSIAVDSLIRFNGGVLNTNSQNLNAGYFYIDIPDNGQLILGDSRITLSGSDIDQQIGDDFFTYFVLDFKTEGNFSVIPGNSLIELTSGDATAMMQIGLDPVQFNDIYFSNTTGQGLLSFPWQPVSFGRIRFNNHGTIDADMSAEHLILAPGKRYRFLAGFTYSFDSITAIGNCLAPITIQALENSATATFLSNGNLIELDYVNLRNIAATGTSSFIASNCADLGNNSGWTIIPRTTQNLYWVGNSGSWDDPAHWSLTSGGTGGACIPSGTDNVFFDLNSFSLPNQVVTINTENAYCRDMTWTGAANMPDLTGGYNSILHVFGSLTMIPAMQYSFGGYLQFEASETGKTITTGNHQVNKVWFQGNGGEWTLLDSLKIEGDFILDAGSLNTNSQYVECTAVNSTLNGVQRKMTLGNTHWVINHFPGADKDQWLILVNNLELNAGTSTIEFGGAGPGGFFEHQGTGNIAYHRVIFSRSDGYLQDMNPGINCTIDTLVFKNGGRIKEDYRIHSLQLEPGFTYLLEEGTIQTIDELLAPGNCNALISIRSSTIGNPAVFKVLYDHPDLQYLSLRDVHNNGPGMLVAQNSVNLGNNQGWTINELSSRTLYWVSNGGNWTDPAHWSLTSGGPGGECPPTPRDDIIFDVNSFTAPGQEVHGRELNGYYCRNMTWTGTSSNPVFNMTHLYCHGSAVFSPEIVYQLSHFHMSGSGVQTVSFNGLSLMDVHVDGYGAYILQDALTADQLFLGSGGLSTNNHPLTLGRLDFKNEKTAFSLALGNSHITINNPADQTNFSLKAPYGPNTVINPGASVIELTHPNAGVYLSGGLTFNNMVFSGLSGLIHISHRDNSSSLENPARFNLLEIGGDAVVKGFNNTDTLIFAPGKSYRLEANVTQTVNEYFKILGNNCIPIELFSTFPGEKSTIFMPQGTVHGEFIQMQDQIAAGGATFFAGVYSTNIENSNQGWIFDSAPEYVEVGFLGPDKSICLDEAVTLSAFNYSPGEIYTWSTGSTSPIVSISEPGTYWARVTFGNMCETVDTIHISDSAPPAVDLGPDTLICEGESLVLDVTSMIPGVTYRWQDGSTAPVFAVTQSGNYTVELNKDGCTSTDMIAITVIESPNAALGPDRFLCEGETLSLEVANSSPATYLWQDGSDQPFYTVSQSGTYSVIVTANGCSEEDEIEVTFNPVPVFSLGPDTSLCTGQTLMFNLTGTGETYRWQDGADTQVYSIQQAGQYWLEVANGACVFADTLQVTYHETPQVDLGADRFLCEGETLSLEVANSSPATYLWQDGSDQPSYTVSQAGIYSVIVTADGCSAEDEIEVTFNPVPVFSLGPDTSLCTGQTLMFNLTGTGETYRWQDGADTQVYSIQQAGQYWLEVANGACVFADTLQVTYHETPQVDLGADRFLCEGETLSLEVANSSSATYLWQDGSDQPSYTVSRSGIYSVIVTANGCSGEDEIEVTFNPVPVFSLGPDTSLCTGQTLMFNLTGTGETYRWQDGADTQVYSIQQAGQYWLEVASGACVFADTLQVTYHETPQVDLGADRFLCEGETLSLEVANSSSATYLWQDGSDQPSYTVSRSGIYSVIVTANGCSGEDEIEVTFNPVPVFSLGPDTSLCTGQTLMFNLTGTGETYRWQDGADTQIYSIQQAGQYWLEVASGACVFADTLTVAFRMPPVIDLGPDQTVCADEIIILEPEIDAYDGLFWQDGSSTPSFVVEQTGNYWLEAILDGCRTRDSVSISFKSLPDPGFPDTVTLCAGESFTLRPILQDGSKVTWQDGSGGPEFPVDENGLYFLLVEDGTCQITDTVRVTVANCGKVRIYVPNAFSPDGDGINDRFLPQFDPDEVILDYQIKIFDRWGGQVYASQDQTSGWDGSIRGQHADFGVYVYIIRVRTAHQSGFIDQIVSGDVTLIR